MRDTSDFENVINHSIFVDKTLLIREFLQNEDKKILITAPDGFGKSTNTHMIKRFLEIQTEKGEEMKSKTNASNYKIFSDNNLNIFQDAAFFNDNFGKYPVIYIDYKPLREIQNYYNFLETLKKIILKSFLHHEYLLNIKAFWGADLDLEEFKNYTCEERNEKLESTKILKSFQYLSFVLHRYFRRKVFVLIDEYDAFVHALVFKKKPDFEKITSFIFSVNKFLRCNNTIEGIFLTGVLTLGEKLSPIDVEEYSFLQNHRFCKYFGITQNELDYILVNNNEKDKLKNNIEDHYGGYVTLKQNIKLYNTRSVLKFLSTRVKFSSFYNSDSLKYVFQVLKISDQIKLLMLGYFFDIDISKSFSKYDILRLNSVCTSLKVKDNEELSLFFVFIYSLGYLVIDTGGMERIKLSKAPLRIPNQDVFWEFTKLLRKK